MSLRRFLTSVLEKAPGVLGQALPYAGPITDIATGLLASRKKSENVVRPAVLADRNALGVLNRMPTTVDVRDATADADRSYRAVSRNLGRSGLLAAYSERLATGNRIMGEKARTETQLQSNKIGAMADATSRYDLADMESKMRYREDLEMRDAAVNNMWRSGIAQLGAGVDARQQADLENSVGLAAATGMMTSDSSVNSIIDALESHGGLSPAMKRMIPLLRRRVANSADSDNSAASATSTPSIQSVLTRLRNRAADFTPYRP